MNRNASESVRSSEWSGERPRLAITMGDAAGIGPELALRACLNSDVPQWCRPLFVGHPQFVEQAASLLSVDVRLAVFDDLNEWNRALTDRASKSSTTGDRDGIDAIASTIDCWNPLSNDDVLGVAAGTIDPRAGRAAYECLVAATQAALRSDIDAITTAPLNKAALHRAGLNYPGHTEILAEQCGVSDFAMMLYLPRGSVVSSPHGLGVAHVTLHTSIRSVPDLISTDAIAEKIVLIDRFMRNVGCARPRIAVCALNPHAGEEGLFGDEEARCIAPAVEQVRRTIPEIQVTGPLPADTLLRRAVGGEFDGVVAMYHDQGHIALKLIGFDRAVNITLGLPIVRTSPSHGTAFEIAWEGKADVEGMLEAVRIASLLAESRPRLRTPAVEDSGRSEMGRN